MEAVRQEPADEDATGGGVPEDAGDPPDPGDPGETAFNTEDDESRHAEQIHEGSDEELVALGSTRPLIDMTVWAEGLPPLIDPGLFAALNPLRTQVAAIAAAAMPTMPSLNQQIAASITRVLPRIDLTPFLPALDMSQYFPRINLWASSPAFRELLEHFRRHRPPNWPEAIGLDRVVEVIRDDGIPLVWVPRAELVQGVVDAEDRGARVAVLIAASIDLVQDCRSVLPGVTHSTLAGQQQLAERCVEAFEHGHHEAAQALAVVVIETAVSRTLGDNYAKVKRQVLFDRDLVPYTELRLRAALAPIYRFYTEWHPKSPHPAPEAISRHVTVHHADPSHYTEANALVAVMLACSVLRASRASGIGRGGRSRRENRLSRAPELGRSDQLVPAHVDERAY